jgi:hypothetical protein
MISLEPVMALLTVEESMLFRASRDALEVGGIV